MKRAPQELDAIVDVVLSYRPPDKAKKLIAKAKKVEKKKKKKKKARLTQTKQ